MKHKRQRRKRSVLLHFSVFVFLCVLCVLCDSVVHSCLSFVPFVLFCGHSVFCLHHAGIVTRSPPFMALSCAQMPTSVQFALVGASGNAGCAPSTAIRKLCARCG